MSKNKKTIWVGLFFFLVTFSLTFFFLESKNNNELKLLNEKKIILLSENGKEDDSFTKKYPHAELFIMKNKEGKITRVFTKENDTLSTFLPVLTEKEESPSIDHTILTIEKLDNMKKVNIEVLGDELPKGIPFLASSIEKENKTNVIMMFYNGEQYITEPVWIWFDGILFEKKK